SIQQQQSSNEAGSFEPASEIPKEQQGTRYGQDGIHDHDPGGCGSSCLEGLHCYDSWVGKTCDAPVLQMRGFSGLIGSAHSPTADLQPLHSNLWSGWSLQLRLASGFDEVRV